MFILTSYIYKKEYNKLIQKASEKAKQFPKLEGFQVALLRTQRSTGHVLTSNFEPFIKIFENYNKKNIETYSKEVENQETYTVFNSLDSAKDYIEINKDMYIHVEFCIYDKNEKFIYSSITSNSNLE